MKFYFTHLFIFISGFVFSQSATVKDSNTISLRHTFQPTGALVAYYFWEEDSIGNIVNNEIKQPFLQNYFITPWINKNHHTIFDYAQLNGIINAFAHTKTVKKKKHSFKIIQDNKKIKVNYSLIRDKAESIGSIVYIKKNNIWTAQKKSSVHYFTISSDNRWKYSHSNDSITLEKENIKIQSNGQYLILKYLNIDNSLGKEVVYTYSGTEVTNDVIERKLTISQRVLVFSNGYRGPTRNKDETDDLVTNKDRYHYWFKLDNLFIERLKPAETFYIDGSMGINTSNHKTFRKFILSYFRSTFIFRKKKAKNKYKTLNTISNLEGFEIRKNRGKIAGKSFLTAICNSPDCLQTKDTVDIVCHSMGYAYSLGFIEEIKDKVVFGKMYIIAPESACVDGFDWTLFQEVWQYGSNLDQKDPDPIWEQDGVAPQCQVKGLEKVDLKKGGRAFIPKDWPRKNFIDSHQPYNYYWMFERIKLGENGYVYK